MKYPVSNLCTSVVRILVMDTLEASVFCSLVVGSKKASVFCCLVDVSQKTSKLCCLLDGPQKTSKLYCLLDGPQKTSKLCCLLDGPQKTSDSTMLRTSVVGNLVFRFHYISVFCYVFGGFQKASAGIFPWQCKIFVVYLRIAFI